MDWPMESLTTERAAVVTQKRTKSTIALLLPTLNELQGQRPTRFPITDALNIYRGYDRKILLDPDFEHFLRGPVLEPLVTGMCGLRGLKSVEIPGDEPVRIGGITKRSIIYNGSMVLLMVAR